MHINLHEPVRGAKALFVPLGVRIIMVLIIGWMWVRKKVYEEWRNCITTFNPVDRFSVIFYGRTGTLVLHDFGQQQHDLLKIKMGLEYAKIRLKHDGVRFTASDCKERVTFLACGCSVKFLWLSQDTPFNKDQRRSCENCGKYHQGMRKENDIYEYCKKHRVFFERWPEVNPGCYSLGSCFQLKGIDPLDALSILRERSERGQVERDRQEELVSVIAKDRTWANDAVEINGLEPDLRLKLIRSIWRKWKADVLLRRYMDGKLDLEEVEVRHLKKVRIYWTYPFWPIVFLLGSGTLLMWLKYPPTIQSLAVIFATVVAVRIFYIARRKFR